jgi:DNA (cytosine-5)-methyltransferase 1
VRDSRTQTASGYVGEAHPEASTASRRAVHTVTPGAERIPQIGGDDYAFLRRKSRPDYETGDGTVRLVDLFAGCGGLSLGVAEACRSLKLRLDIRLAVEALDQTWTVYAANFGNPFPARPSDVFEWFDGRVGSRPTKNEVTARRLVGPVTILVGGPPCQGHSTLNNHTRGDDPKNQLYLRMTRAAEILSPTHVVVENVPSLERDRSGVLRRAVGSLERLGYAVVHKVLHLAELGVPQLRARHVLVATKIESPLPLMNARGLGASRSLRWAIGDVKAGPDLMNTASSLSKDNERRARWLLENDRYDLPNRQRPECHRDPSHKYKSMYGRLDWDRPAQTITSGFGSPGQGRYLHPSLARTITPHEAARLQFLPDWFDFSGVVGRKRLQEMIGNAVPPKLGFVVALDLLGKQVAASRIRSGQLPRRRATGR